MPGGLTARQREVLEYFRDCVRLDGRPPTLREAARHFGWSASAALTCHLRALERKGAIRWDRGAARGICLNDDADGPEITIPVLADVPAGPPAEALLDAGETIPLSRSAFPRPEEIFALRVKGRSMTGAGILDGDWLLVRKAREARHGQIVVARVDNEVTVKRFMRERGRVYLKAENPEYRDIRFQGEQEVAIEGIGLGVFRLF